MRTSAKRRSLDRAAELEAELLALQALDELALYDAEAELDRYYAELLGPVDADRGALLAAALRERDPRWWDVLR